MTRACCPSCRLRFTRAASAHLTICPECGAPLQTGLAAHDSMGYQLHDVRDTQSDLRKKKAALEAELNSLMDRIEF